MFGKKKRDEVSRKRDARAEALFRKCGKQRQYKQPNGSIVTVYCQKNANVAHRCD